jgi:Cytochrome P450
LSETTPDNLMRFYDTNIVAARPNLAFMPFGAGPHRCFGAAMGYLQAQFLLAQIHQRFRIQTRPGWASRDDPGLPWPVADSRPAAPIAPAIAAVSMIPRTCTLPRAGQLQLSRTEPNRLDAVASVANWAAVSIPPGSRTRTSAPSVAWCTCRAPRQASSPRFWPPGSTVGVRRSSEHQAESDARIGFASAVCLGVRCMPEQPART